MSETAKESVEIASFEGPGCYHSLKVKRDSNGISKLVIQRDGVQTIILDRFGRWFSEEHSWKELEQDLEEAEDE